MVDGAHTDEPPDRQPATAAPGPDSTSPLHSLVDDHFRHAYSEILPDEKGST